MSNFLIGSFETGLERDKEPFAIPEDAFPKLEDAFVFRGRVERRKGFVNQGRLRRFISGNPITQTTVAGTQQIISDVMADAPTVPPSNLRATEPNAEIQPGSVTVTVNGTDVWLDTDLSGNPNPGVLRGAAGNAITAGSTIDYVTGRIVVNSSVAVGAGLVISVQMGYFPSFPVMGLRTREQSVINREQTIAFDRKYAYRFISPTGWEELPSNTATTWNGNDSQFFWTINYRGTLASEQFFWTTNFNQSTGGGDPIRYYDPNAAPADWITFRPTIRTGVQLEQARILIPFRNRLVALNTWEGSSLAASTQFAQRCRFSQNGDPTDTTNGWLETTVGRGGFIDAPTSEEIISAQFVKDRLIVFFERSTWELVYAGNAALPFIWQKINTELGAESTFSEVPFDDGVISVGDVGIHIANSSGVQRIDAKIPDEVGRIINANNGTERVYGIRDFDKEVIYWTFPQFQGDKTFPNKVLLYNYRNNTFAIYNDRFTCYGYFQKTTGYTWDTLPYDTWSEWTAPWNSGITQSFHRQIIAGNQQGFTQVFDDSLGNGATLSLTSITTPGIGNRSTVTVPNHNLDEGMYVTFQNLTGITITPLAPNTTQTFQIQSIVNANDFTIDGTAVGTYPGGGTVTVLNNINITTKNFDFFTNTNADNFLKEIHLLLGKTSGGEISLDVFRNFDTSTGIDPLLGTKSVLTQPENDDSYASNQNKIWHKSIRNVIGDSFQLQISLDDTQMRTTAIQTSDVVLHAIMLSVEPTGRAK
ncbi:MAG: hypothetical protein ACE5GV_00395 [Candidatus Scalindua sp.]